MAARDAQARIYLSPPDTGDLERDSYVTGVSDDLFARGICLPSGSRLAEADVDRVAGLVRSALGA